VHVRPGPDVQESTARWLPRSRKLDRLLRLLYTDLRSGCAGSGLPARVAQLRASERRRRAGYLPALTGSRWLAEHRGEGVGGQDALGVALDVLGGGCLQTRREIAGELAELQGELLEEQRD